MLCMSTSALRRKDLGQPGHGGRFTSPLESAPELELVAGVDPDDGSDYFEPDLRDVEADVAQMFDELGPDFVEQLDLGLDAPFIPDDDTPPF